MNGKTTHVFFNGEHVTETPQLYQYDYGQTLVFDDITLPEAYEVYFSNNVTSPATVAVGTSEGVLIPDHYLTTGKNVLAWVFLHEGEDDGETEYVVRIPVRPRSSFTDEDIPEHERSELSDLIAIVNHLIEEYNAAIEQVNAYEDRIVALEKRVPALGGWATDDGGESNDSTD